MRLPPEDRRVDGLSQAADAPHQLPLQTATPPAQPSELPISGVVSIGEARNQSRTQFTIGPTPPMPILCDRISTAEEFLRSRVNSTMPDVECHLRNTYHPFEFDITVCSPDFYSLSCHYPPLTNKPARELPEVYDRRNQCAAEGVAEKLGELYVATGSIPQQFIFVFRSPKTYIVEVSPGDDIDRMLDAFETTSYSVAGEGRIPDWQGRLDKELERQARERRRNTSSSHA